MLLVVVCFGGIMIVVVVIIVVLCIGKDVYEDLDWCYVVGFVNGVIYLIGGFFVGMIVMLFFVLLKVFVVILVGFVLIGVISVNVYGIFEDENYCEVLVIMFFVIVLGMIWFGFGLVFWGIVIGLVVYGVLNRVWCWEDWVYVWCCCWIFDVMFFWVWVCCFLWFGLLSVWVGLGYFFCVLRIVMMFG